ncbi:UV-stimulated scaffold protein A [Petromyzon marinus]|uniref:UV-stimulated scaffold protein A n=1 Tax=Petromyzon marinus TaxID=7757 RepID=UPI003F716F48
MELAACERLSQLLEELTTAGGERLDPAGMKELKKICKQSDAYVQHAYQLLLTQLRQEHSEVRLAALLVADELFSRSHAFRLALLSDLQLVLELTAETDPERPLPPPSAAAHRLRGLALRTVHAWHERYGQDYRKLALGYHFLKHARKVDFQDVQARSLAQRQREAEQQRRQETLNKEKARKAAAEMEETVGELQDCLTQAESCFRLLLPSLGEFDVFPSDAGSAGRGESPAALNNGGNLQCNPSLGGASAAARDEEGSSATPRSQQQPGCSTDDASAPPPSCGWGSGVVVTQGVSDPDEDDEDEDDDDDDDEDSGEGGEAAGGGSGKEEQGPTFMRDHGLISHSYSLTLEIPPVVVVQEDEDNSAVLTTLRDQLGLIQTRHLPRVQAWLQAFTRAGVNDASLKRAIDIKMALEATVKKHEEMNIHYRASRAQHSPVEESDSEFEEVPEKDGYEPHIPEHRRAEYGLEPESLQEPRPGPSRGLAPGGPGTSRAAALRTCRAPLPDGRLCERADRHKCPFHGKIVPRDEQGVPASAEDAARLERERRQREEAERPGWRDAELMRDIEAATGLDLGSSRPERGKGRGKGKRKKYPNLTDVKQLNNTARSRLERKVFNRASVKRVSAAMSKLDRGKHERFTNQFTYALT